MSVLCLEEIGNVSRFVIPEQACGVDLKKPVLCDQLFSANSMCQVRCTQTGYEIGLKSFFVDSNYVRNGRP